MTARQLIPMLVLAAAAVVARAQSIGPQPVDNPAFTNPETVPAASAAEARGLGRSRPMSERQPLVDQASDAKSGSIGWPRVVAALAGTIALAVGVAAAARRLSGGTIGIARSARAPSGLMEVLARYPLSPRESLIVLKLDRRVLLLSQPTGGRGMASGVRTLTEITDPEEVASILLKTRDDEGDSIAARFRDAMDRHSIDFDSFDDSSQRPVGVGRLAELA